MTSCGAIPQNLSSLVVYYNRDLFDAAGLAYPANNWTREDFLAVAQALTQDLVAPKLPVSCTVMATVWPRPHLTRRLPGHLSNLRIPLKDKRWLRPRAAPYRRC